MNSDGRFRIGLGSRADSAPGLALEGLATDFNLPVGVFPDTGRRFDDIAVLVNWVIAFARAIEGPTPEK